MRILLVLEATRIIRMAVRNQLTDGGRGEGVLVVKANLMMLDRGVHFNLYTGAVHTSRYNSVITTKYSQSGNGRFLAYIPS